VEATTHHVSAAVVSVDELSTVSAEPFLMQTAQGDRIPFPLPIEVAKGTSVREILDRHGDQVFFHPAVGQPFPLRSLFAAAGLSPDETMDDRETLVHRLESEPIDLKGYLGTRAVVGELLTPDAMLQVDQVAGGKLAALSSSARAAQITGVSPDSAARQAAGDSTVSQVAAQSQDAFVKKALRGASVDKRPQVEAEARLLWTRAVRIQKLVAPVRKK